jgi:hypothetical protein
MVQRKRISRLRKKTDQTATSGGRRSEIALVYKKARPLVAGLV